MAKGDRTVSIKIGARDAASKVLGGVSTGLKGLGAAAIAATAALAAAAFAITKLTQLAAAQEEAEVSLAAALRTIGSNTREVREDILKFNSALQDSTTVDDQAILKIEQLLITLGKLEGEGLKKATAGVLDLAAVLGRDATPIAQVLAKAVQGDTRALKQFGIEIDQTATATEQWAEVLTRLEQIEGVAAARGETFRGTIARLQNNLQDAGEELGFLVVENREFKAAIGIVSDAVIDFSDALKEQPAFLADVELAISSLTVATAELGVSALQSIESLFSFGRRIPNFLEFFFKDLPPSQEATDIFKSLDRATVLFVQRELDAEEAADGLGATIRILGAISAAAALRVELLRKQFDFIGPPESAVDVAESLGPGLKSATQATEELTAAAKKYATIGVESLAAAEEEAEVLRQKMTQVTEAFFLGDLTQEQFELLSEQIEKAAIPLEQFGIMLFEILSPDALDALEQLKAVWGAIGEEVEAGEEALSRLGFQTRELEIVIAGQLINSVLQFGDALVDAAFGAEFSFKKFAKEALREMVKLIVQALILKAILASLSGGTSLFFAQQGGEVPVQAAHGGVVRGGIFGRDSVLAALTPGELVLPTSVAAAFKDVVAASRAIADRGGGARALSGPGFQGFFQIDRVRDEQEIAELIEAFNEAAERKGFRIVATELIG